MRIIGDCHGKFRQYFHLIKDVEYSVQVGDFGFEQAYEFLKQMVNPEKHKIVLGNHDDYDYIKKHGLPHNLGDYGVTNHGGHTFYYCRGAFSIDCKARLRNESEWGKTYWPEEELPYFALYAALKLYEYSKPNLVITHDCPQSIVDMVGHEDTVRAFGWEVPLKTVTQQALQSMFEVHQPKMWVFGHYHTSKRFTINGTEFICLSELEYIDI